MASTEKVNYMRRICQKSGFFILGILSLLYIIFSRSFAEMCVQFSFLGFPVFIGEIFLAFFLLLSLFVFDFRSIKGWKWVVVFYFLCVIAKAIWGYSLWGPLSFRHAALFYYLVFIFFGFIFYNRAFLSEPLRIFIASLILVICVTKCFNDYWTLALWIIAFILIKSFSSRGLKYFFYAVLLPAILLSYKVIILTSRTFIVSNISAVVFLIITAFFMLKIKTIYKPVIAGAIFILLVIFVFKFSLVNSFGTVLDLTGSISQYRQFDAEIKGKRKYYLPQKIKKAKLFNPGSSTLSGLEINEIPQVKAPEKEAGSPEQPALLVPAGNKISQVTTLKKEAGSPEHPALLVPAGNKISQVTTLKKEQDILKNNINRKIKPIMKERSHEEAYGNTVFRLLIWRDMIAEFSRYRPILGFSFGKPFRSESLEILNLGNRDWLRDGWIEPHNSYLNMLYRMGILGVALIGFLIWQFCGMVKGFATFKSLSGILLCSILINWLVAANFLPILELPYNAIPFWALWGVTLGYLKELKDRRGDA